MIQEHLEQLGCRWSLVGGHAVSARSAPRFTKDIDVCIAVQSDEEAEALVQQLHLRGYRVLQLLEHEPTGRLGTVRLALPGSESSQPDLDLLFASSGIEPEVVAAAEPLEIEQGLTVPVATRAHLIALKVLAADPVRRPQDVADLVALLGRASDGEIRTARGGLELIAERGFDRGKDLNAELDSILCSVRRKPT